MRNVLVCLGLAGCVLLGAACSSKPTAPLPTGQPTAPLPTTHGEDRVSQSPAGTIAATLNRSQFNGSGDFLLTLSNSTEEPIELPTSLDKNCYADTFWFYTKTAAGWQPVPQISSFICLGDPPTAGALIPSGLEKEFNIAAVVFSRAVDFQEPKSYILGIRYLDPIGQEFFLITDEFRSGAAAPIDVFYVTVDSAAPGALGFSITNNLNQPLWLASLCSSTPVALGWMDSKHSTLHRLTDAESWSYVHITMDDCVQTTEVVEIAAGETKTIDGAKWLQDAGVSLQPGRYRWDLVFYLGRNPRGVYEGRHLFSDIFRYED